MRQIHLTQIPAGAVLGGVVEVVGSNLARGEIFTASLGSVDLRLICNPHKTNPTVICLPHPSLHYLKSASTHWNYTQRPIGTPPRTLPHPTVHFWSDIVELWPIFCISFWLQISLMDYPALHSTPYSHFMGQHSHLKYLQIVLVLHNSNLWRLRLLLSAEKLRTSRDSCDIHIISIVSETVTRPLRK